MVKGLAICMAVGASLAPIAPRAANELLSIETSTVAQDLRAFYSETYPENTLAYLTPNKSDGDRYSDFRFLTMYANAGDLYVYFFAKSYASFEAATLEYSSSTTIANDGTSIDETYQTVPLEIVSTNGDYSTFYKCVAEGFYTHTVGDQHRVFASQITLTSTDGPTMARLCDDAEYSWEDKNEGEDQVYTFYRDNYLVIDEAKVVQQHMVTEWANAAMTKVQEIREINWLFFDWAQSSLGYDYSFGKLKGITISYEHLTYEMSYRVGYNAATLYNAADSFISGINGASDASFSVKTSRVKEATVTPGQRTIDELTYQRKWLFIWNVTHAINYTYSTIQKLDDDSVSSIGDSEFKEFIDSKREGYSYAIDFLEEKRVVSGIEDSDYNLWDTLRDCKKVTSLCHEASDASIVSLTFETEYGECNLNGIMDPVDTTSAVTTVPENSTTISFDNEAFESAINTTLRVLLAVGVSILLLFVIRGIYRLFKGRKVN